MRGQSLIAVLLPARMRR